MNLPTLGSQTAPLTRITSDVLGKFRLPEFRVGGRIRGIPTAAMSVPEAAVDEDNRSEARQNDVRSSGKLLVMQSEPKSRRMESTTHGYFGHRVPSGDSGHHPASRSPVDDVCYAPKTSATTPAIRVASAGGTALPTC